MMMIHSLTPIISNSFSRGWGGFHHNSTKPQVNEKQRWRLASLWIIGMTNPCWRWRILSRKGIPCYGWSRTRLPSRLLSTRLNRSPEWDNVLWPYQWRKHPQTISKQTHWKYEHVFSIQKRPPPQRDGLCVDLTSYPISPLIVQLLLFSCRVLP